jgi:nucleoside-diphosphate-sugar epimerase
MQIKKKILLVGGSGDIGMEISRRIPNSIFYIFDKKNFYNDMSSNIKFLKGSLFNKKDLEKIPKKIDIVIFLAGAKGGPNSIHINNAPIYFKNNFITLHTFLEFSKNIQFKKIIFTSTEQVYGNNYNFLKNKQHELKPINFYGLSKLACEKILYSYHQNYKVDVDILRFPRVVSANNINLISSIIFKLLNKKNIIINYTKSSFNFIFIDDFIDALIKCLKLKTKYRILNIFNNEIPISLLKLSKLIQSKLNTSCKIIVKDKTVIKDHNPKNLNISNSDTKNKIKWNPKFSINLMVDILIKTFKNESRPNN